MSECKKLTDFEVAGNNFDGQLPALNFSGMSMCFLLNGGQNRFSCPWLPGVTEKCQYDDGVLVTNADCHGTAPPKYSCDDTTGTPAHGTCNPDPLGTQTLGECYGSCKCIAQHNCGQLNGTVQCGTLLQDCNVCPSCCFSFNLTQSKCNQCFTDPVVPGAAGCGNKISAFS
jgi:hypothetical protein